MKWPTTMVAPEGLAYVRDFLSAGDEDALLLEALEFKAVVMHGTPAKRTTVHFGYDYAYDTARVHETTPMPAFLAALRDKAAKAANVPPAELAETRIAVSAGGRNWLASRCACVWRAGGGRVARVGVRHALSREWEGGREVFIQRVEPRSLYAMRGPARRQWQHHIASTPALRYSITFRTLRNPPANHLS